MNTFTPEEVTERKLHISETGIFAGLKSETLHHLESMGVYMEYQQEMVAASGQDLAYFFFVIQGSFEVSKVEPESGKKVVLANIGEGQCFGEMSFFTGAPASANVIAVGTVVCWAIHHTALREFIELHDKGAHLAINIGALLAIRVQEGNARLVGLSASLSAYFGHQARQSGKGKVAPKSNQTAEMEIPDEIFDEFVAETLKLKADAEITAEQRSQIRAKIEADELDIVPWLEKGDRGDHLKMRLKLVQESKPSQPRPSRRPSSTLMQPTLLKIPQIRAQVLPEAVPAKSSFSKWLNVSSYLAIPLLTAAILILLLPVQTRESLVDSKQFKSIPFHSFIEGILVHSTVQKNPWILQKGATQTIQMTFPKTVFLRSNLEISQSVPSTLQIRLAIKQKETGTSVLNRMIEIRQHEDFLSLFSVQLPPGSYVLECSCEDWPTEIKIPASIVVNARS